jgi:O-antigen/teichoic acid export membrane protein
MSNRFYIARNSLYNIVGWIIPAIVQLLAVPYIVRNLGYDAYGVWSLVMAVMGYFAFLDMNMLRGGIRYLAEYDGKKDKDSASQVVSFGLMAYMAIGLVGLLIIAACVEPVLLKMLKIPESLNDMARHTLYLAALGFFLLMTQTYLLSIPRALHRFDISNKIEIMFQVGGTGAVVGMLFLGYGLLEIVIVRIIANVICIVAAYVSIHKLMPYYKFSPRIDRKIAKEISSYSLVSFAGRLGVSTTSYANTFIAGSLLGTTAVTLFTVPFMLVDRIMNISSRLSMVIFPIASALGAQARHNELIAIYKKMTNYIFTINLYLTLVLCLFSWNILALWMGEKFADTSSFILLTVAIGYLFNTTTTLPSLVNDGIGKPKVTSAFAFIHGFVAVGLVTSIGMMLGLNGIAIGYCMSCIVMAITFNIYVHKKVIGISWSEIIAVAYFRSVIFSVLIVITFVVLRVNNLLPGHTIVSIMAEIIVVSLLYFVFAFRYVLEPGDRSRITTYAGRLIGRAAKERP